MLVIRYFKNGPATLPSVSSTPSTRDSIACPANTTGGSAFAPPAPAWVTEASHRAGEDPSLVAGKVCARLQRSTSWPPATVRIVTSRFLVKKVGETWAHEAASQI